MKNLKTLNEYGGSEWSVITSAKNFLYIDMGKFRDKLKDKKHLKAFDKAKKAFWDVIGPVAEEHHEMYEGKLTEALYDDDGSGNYKYKKQVAKAFDKINDAMFNFRHAMGVKQLSNKDMKLKRKLEDMQQAIFNLQKEMKSDGLTEGKLTEASSNFKVLLRTSQDESIGRKIRLGGKRDPGQEVWQKVDKMNWMNLKNKQKLDLNKWAKHADEFHMADKDLQFEGKLTEDNNTQYSWGQINDALTSLNMSPRKIGYVRLALKKQE